MAFDISQISSDFRNELGGGLYLNKIVEGQVVSLVTQMPGIPGSQDLNKAAFDLTWRNDGRTAVTNGASGASVFERYDSNLDFSRRTLNIQMEYAQGRQNPHSVDTSYIALQPGRGSNYDPNTAILDQAVSDLVGQGRKRIAERFYTGYGATATNGLNDITGTAVNTGTGAVSATNIISKLATIHATIATSEIAAEEDLVIIMSAANYLHYRQALRTAGLNDVLQSEVAADTFQSSPWIDDPRIQVIGDPGYTGLPFATNLSNIVFGTYNGSDIDSPDLWYDKTAHTINFRSIFYAGVQVFESGNLYRNNNAA